MKKFIFLFFCFCFIFIFPKKVSAAENPFSSFNNKVGVHILFPAEIKEASELVNSNGGDWGYVTIPIQSGDKDLAKWQLFMDEARKLHVIPIIRLATEGDYLNTKVWRKPTEDDIIDFANFLSSLKWPVKNRYIIVFNETNRGDEWGGYIEPEKYAQLLSYSVSIFKAKSQDYFIISAGLDNAAPNSPPNYENEYDYLTDMNTAIPGIFNQIDGLGSHSYPNPGFSQSPTNLGKMGIYSFIYERQLVKNLSSKELPVFITETGWSTNVITNDKCADYYTQAFNGAWSDNNIVAITPFLLRANGAFNEFSLIDINGTRKPEYKAIHSLAKVRGLPQLNQTLPPLLRQQKKLLGLVTGEEIIKTAHASTSYRNFNENQKPKKMFSLTKIVTSTLQWLIGI